MNTFPEILPYNGEGLPPRLRSDLILITKGDLLAALLLDYLILRTALTVEVRKTERQSFWSKADDYEISADPVRIQRGSGFVFEIWDIEEKLGKLKELGLINTNSLFSLRVNIQTIDNVIAGLTEST